MNKTMINAINKSSINSSVDYVIPTTTVPPKRSSSGKTKKPKSGRNIAVSIK